MAEQKPRRVLMPVVPRDQPVTPDPIEQLRRAAAERGLPVPPEPEFTKRLRFTFWRSLERFRQQLEGDEAN